MISLSHRYAYTGKLLNISTGLCLWISISQNGQRPEVKADSEAMLKQQVTMGWLFHLLPYPQAFGIM